MIPTAWTADAPARETFALRSSLPISAFPTVGHVEAVSHLVIKDQIETK
jgi:hypothetical protein